MDSSLPDSITSEMVPESFDPLQSVEVLLVGIDSEEVTAEDDVEALDYSVDPLLSVDGVDTVDTL